MWNKDLILCNQNITKLYKGQLLNAEITRNQKPEMQKKITAVDLSIESNGGSSDIRLNGITRMSQTSLAF